MAAFILAFYGFLRVSEFTVSSHASFNTRIATPTHVTIHRNFYSFLIPKSKTDQQLKGEKVYIYRSKSSTCPLQYMTRYLDQRRLPPRQGPLFIFKDATPLTRRSCLYHVRLALVLAGYTPTNFNKHSLRIGATTSAAKYGLSAARIKVLGRWKSNAHKSYIRTGHTNRKAASCTMASRYKL